MWKRIGFTVILLIIIANLIALQALPDALTNASLLVLTLIAIGIGVAIWRSRSNHTSED